MIRSRRDMKLLHVETLTGGALPEIALPAILADAECMRQAQLADLAALPDAPEFAGGLRVSSLLDARLGLDTPAGIELHQVPAGTFPQVLQRELLRSDAVWLTAPETGDQLATLSRQVLDAGCRLLGSDVATVRLCSSKLQCVQWLAAHGVPCVPTLRDPRVWRDRALLRDGVIVKPDDGVGCEGQRRFDTVDRAWAWGQAELGERAVYQPWLEGTPLSLSLLCADGRASLLSVNRQWIREHDGALRLHGVTVGARGDADGTLARLAAAVARALAGLWGHAGVDLVLGPAGPVVLEINPRTTLSYAGLREALGLNPARALLDLPHLPHLPAPAHPSRSVRVELAHAATTT